MKTRWRPHPAALRLRSIICFVCIDLASILVGFGVAILMRTIFLGETVWLFLYVTLVPLYLIAAVNNHAYDSVNLQNPFLSIRRGVQAMAVAIVATVIVGYLLKASDNLGRLVIAFGFVLSCGFLFIGRFLFTQHFQAIIGGNPFNVIILQDGDYPVPAGPFSVIVAVAGQFDPEADDPAMYDRLAKTLQSADRVLIACAPERRTAWAHALKGISVQGEIVVPEFGSLIPLGMGLYGETPTMVVSTGPLGLVDQVIKRCFDLTLAGCAALFFSPLLVLIAIMIKLDSDGPVLFKQTRIGRNNELFQVLKFRSMRVETLDGAGHRSATRDDDRITCVGRIIRSSSIDELPQLFNVLKGNMSIVGPRPHALGSRAADKLFWEVDQRYWHRHAAKPGLTGLAQVRGFRGATIVEADLANRLQADLEYLEDWTIWRDIKIIFLTFRVLFHRNAF